MKAGPPLWGQEPRPNANKTPNSCQGQQEKVGGGTWTETNGCNKNCKITKGSKLFPLTIP